MSDGDTRKLTKRSSRTMLSGGQWSNSAASRPDQIWVLISIGLYFDDEHSFTLGKLVKRRLIVQIIA